MLLYLIQIYEELPLERIGTSFPKNSFLPQEYSFFQNIKYKDITGTSLPQDTIDNLHLYDLNNIKIDYSLYNLSNSQLYIIYKKQEK